MAREAGVSSAVVSYVMNNGPRRVAPETEQKVRQAVELLGYRPNLTARSLSRGSTQLLGLVLIDLLNPFFAELAEAVEGAAAQRDHTIMMAHSHSDAAVERRRVAELETRGVDGLIVASLLHHPDVVAWARERRRHRTPPTVLLNQDRSAPGLLSIGPTFETGSREAVNHLIQHGHRRIALLGGVPPNRRPRTPPGPREIGWRAALTDAGLAPGPVGHGLYTREGGYLATRRLLTARPAPTALFAVSDLLGIGALRAAHELGLTVPDDLAVISFDGTSESAYSWPAMTSVRQPLQEMAEAAVAHVLQPDEDSYGSHRLFETTLIRRRSCGCPAPAGSPGRTPDGAARPVSRR